MEGIEYRRFSAWQEERAARRAWVLERDPRPKMSAEEWHAHFEALDRFAAHFDDVTPEELEAEITEAIAAVRVEERATFEAISGHSHHLSGAVFQEVEVDLRIL